MKYSNYILVIMLIFCLPGCGTTQQQTEGMGSSAYDIKEHVVDIHVDNLQNIYILTKENKVVKYTDSFDKQFEYSNNLIGEIKSIDATNPQKILCFITDFNRILVLDNTLAEINIIELSTSDYLDVSVAARTTIGFRVLFPGVQDFDGDPEFEPRGRELSKVVGKGR